MISVYQLCCDKNFMGSIGFSQIIVLITVIAFIVGTGYFGIYIVKQNPKLKKYINKEYYNFFGLHYYREFY